LFRISGRLVGERLELFNQASDVFGIDADVFRLEIVLIEVGVKRFCHAKKPQQILVICFSEEAANGSAEVAMTGMPPAPRRCDQLYHLRHCAPELFRRLNVIATGEKLFSIGQVLTIQSPVLPVSYQLAAVRFFADGPAHHNHRRPDDAAAEGVTLLNDAYDLAVFALAEGDRLMIGGVEVLAVRLDLLDAG
jgi:hypothetical protein